MPYKMHSNHLKNVLSLSSRDRYDHFVIKVADWEQLWVLRDADKNLFTRKAPDGFVYLPVWPHPDYAMKINELLESDLEASEIHLDDFIHSWLPDLHRDEMKVGVFPDREGQVWIIEPLDLQNDLTQEASQYE